MSNKYAPLRVALIAGACAVLTACGNLHSKATSATTDTTSAVRSKLVGDAQEAPAEKLVELQLPVVADSKKIASLNNEDFLKELYSENTKLYKGEAATEYSADFTQSGIAKHVFITSFTAKQALYPIMCIDIVEKHGGSFTITEHSANLNKAVMYFHKSHLSWRQYGPDMYALQETYETNDDESKRRSPYSEIKLSARKGATWTSLLDVIQTAEKNETVTQSLYFLKGSRRPWEGRIKTVFNSGKPLVVRYFFNYKEYMPVGTIPKITMKQAEHVRGLPVTDWDGQSVEFHRRKGKLSHRS